MKFGPENNRFREYDATATKNMSKVKPAPLPPDTIIGGYRIIRKVAAGGFGLVYLALDPEGQQVAGARR